MSVQRFDGLFVWEFHRFEYERVQRTRPAICTRVRSQLRTAVHRSLARQHKTRRRSPIAPKLIWIEGCHGMTMLRAELVIIQNSIPHNTLTIL